MYLFALSAELNLELEHMDVYTAFLNGELQELIYVTQLEGYVDKKHGQKVAAD